MAKNLIIVESPTKERVLKEMLGKDFQVTSSKGHIKDLPKSRLGINIENNFEPTWIIIPAKRQMVKKLKTVAKDKENILLATDPDREGEAISWHIAKELNLENSKCRVVFNEITKDVVTDAVQKPRKINMNIVDSQIARRLLDRLVGYKVSPLCYKYARGKSAGRVQSVAVHLIVKREKEIQAFKPEEYWKINALLQKIDDKKENIFEASLANKKGQKININNIEKANKIFNEIKNMKFNVVSIQNKNERKHPPLPFKTSTLQQASYNKLNFSVKRTMRVAQQLYEGISLTGKGTLGLITYMRTDSTRVSNQAKINAREYIFKNYGKEYISSGKGSTKKSQKENNKIQDAHEAIRPTSVYLSPESVKNDLTADQYKLYSLIWTYFIASQMKSALIERSSVKIQAGDYIFDVNGSKVIFQGFLKIITNNDIKKNMIPQLKVGEKLILVKLEKKQSFTKPPARYNEASLVKVLEKEGIGRPSTYAVIIDKIQSRNYVDRDNRKFIPTKLGIIVDDFLNNYFSNIINIKFTATMEKMLDRIESGESEWQDTLDNFYKSLLKDIQQLEKKPPVKLVEQSKEFSDEKCTVCGSRMEIKNGPYGKYLACSEFPIKHPTKTYLIKIGVSCPENNCDGEIIKRKSKKGRTFYGCSNYPNCNFYSIYIPTNEKCPECGSVLVKRSSKKKGYFLQCSSKECKYSKKAKNDE